MNIVIPLAGKDEEFIQEYHDLKCFVNVDGKPLITKMLQCLPFNLNKLIFIILGEYEKQFDVSRRLKSIFGSKIAIIIAKKLTEGSPCSILLAQELIDNDEELLIDLADVYFTPLSLKECIENRTNNISGIIPICSGRVMERPWGYVYKNKQGIVTALKEKEMAPSSDFATLGIYFFSKGFQFVTYAKEMIKRNLRVPNYNLFYVGPLYNLFLQDGHRIDTCSVNIKYVFGNVNDLKNYNKFGKRT